MTETAVLFSASEAYLGHAVHGLRRLFPDARLDELAPEVGRIHQQGLSITDVADACLQVSASSDAIGLPFVRHLAAEETFVLVPDIGQVPEMAKKVAQQAGGSEVSLQVWGSGKVVRRPPELRSEVEAALAGAGIATARGGLERVVSVCLTPAGAHIGAAHRRDMLADWPGGRVVLGRPAEQVSRAEWKLEELFKVDAKLRVFDPGLSDPGLRHRALDLGASPGGWTRILRSKGYEVWAVDPGDLHPAVAADPKVHHEVTTAGRFLATTEVSFDLVVNDMRMVAERSCETMVAAARRLEPGGMAVTTLKVSTRQPAATIERALKILARAYEPVFVRQLYHNKNEVTVVARRS